LAEYRSKNAIGSATSESVWNKAGERDPVGSVIEKLAIHNVSSVYRSTLHPEIYLRAIDIR
jgi:hypothetical protein